MIFSNPGYRVAEAEWNNQRKD